MKKIFKIVIILMLVSFLMLIRIFEDSLFYDPLLSFFKTDHTTNPLPKFDSLKLLSNVVLRFSMNTIISLAIIWILFKDTSILKFSVILYFILLIPLFTVFYFSISYSNSENFLTLFYVRRFLIQPLFLLILLPAFYFHRRK